VVARRHNVQRCVECGARLILMRFDERTSYHCQTHGPFILDADGNLRRLERTSAERTTLKRKPTQG
jgi:hypothetical protein